MKKYSTYFYLPILLFYSLLLTNCSEEAELEDKNYQLVWQDEFEGPAGQLPNAENWSFDIGTGWGNEQLEFDTDRAENVSLDGNGNLAITARRENFSGSGFTSGRIKTQDLFEQAYGRFEARIKLPRGPGIWPAFWMLGADFDEVGWPQCGEIDIMEFRGQETNIIHGSVHGPGYSAGNAITDTYGLVDDRFDDEFYLFAIEWEEDFIDFFVDDAHYQRISKEDVPGEWVYDNEFFILLNVAVGGTFVGFPTADTPFPQTMLVDYVRVYQAAN